jgi:Ribbon-helix-helix protein, copG family
MVKEVQDQRLGLRVTRTEVEMLNKLSEVTGLSMSDVVRMAIRREYTERVGELPTIKKPKR